MVKKENKVVLEKNPPMTRKDPQVPHNPEELDPVRKEFIVPFEELHLSKKTPGIPYLVSVEKFPLSKIKVLQEVLLDHTPVGEAEQIWYRENIDRVFQILNGKEGDFFCDLKYVYHKVVYEVSNPDTNIGRLYSKSKFSYMYLPREIRGFLVDNEYMDFDMENAHPTLLLEYGKKEMQNSPKILESYVNNREHLLAKKADIDGTSRAAAKTSILKTLNTSESHAALLGYLCPELHLEIVGIRKHIENHCTDDMRKYLENNKSFLKKSPEKKSISIQSLYLQTQETYYVNALVQHLINFTIDTMDSKNLCTSFDSKDKLLDRYIHVHPLAYYLKYTPFFDGVFVGSEDYEHKRRLKREVEHFNLLLEKKGSLVRFKEKVISKEYKRLNPTTLEEYTNIHSLINSLSTSQFNELLALLDMDPFHVHQSQGIELEGLKEAAHKFRQSLYKKLVTTLKELSLPFNGEALSGLRHKYADRLKTKRGLRKLRVPEEARIAGYKPEATSLDETATDFKV